MMRTSTVICQVKNSKRCFCEFNFCSCALVVFVCTQQKTSKSPNFFVTKYQHIFVSKKKFPLNFGSMQWHYVLVRNGFTFFREVHYQLFDVIYKFLLLLYVHCMIVKIFQLCVFSPHQNKKKNYFFKFKKSKSFLDLKNLKSFLI